MQAAFPQAVILNRAVLGEAFGRVRKYPEDEAEKSAVKAKAGRPIMKSLQDLNLPFFLLEICREYAADYLKWPRSKWPEWLRTRHAKAEREE